ncbi:MAG: hypothetical protein U0572_13100 [Phycisphaerales bacterium]
MNSLLLGWIVATTLTSAAAFSQCTDLTPDLDLIPSTAASVNQSHVGDAVAFFGDRLIVGAAGHTVSGESSAGGVQIYRLVSGSWTEEQFLTKPSAIGGPESQDHFGFAVAMQDTECAIGVPGHDGSGTDLGAVVIFTRSGTTWTYSQTLVGDSSLDEFGTSVAIQGDTLVIGAPTVNLGAQGGVGAVYISTKSGGTWGTPVKLQAAAASPSTGGHLGRSVALDGTNVVGGAPWDVTTLGVGRVYVFKKVSGTWGYDEELSTSDSTPAGDYFGMSVAISGDLIAVGASQDEETGSLDGSISFFRECSGSWTFEDEVVACDTDNTVQLGFSLALTKSPGVELAVAGGIGSDGVGAAFVYRNSSAGWQTLSRLVPTSPTNGDDFGTSVASIGFRIAAGVPGDDSNGTNSNVGEVAIFEPGWCAEDLDADGEVGSADLAELLGAWGACSGCAFCFADLDGDQQVGSSDLAILLGAWDCGVGFRGEGESPLEIALSQLGFEDVEAISAWLENATEEEALGAGVALLQLLEN